MEAVLEGVPRTEKAVSWCCIPLALLVEYNDEVEGLFYNKLQEYNILKQRLTYALALDIFV